METTIKFTQDENGGFVALDSNGKKIGNVSQMEQFIEDEPLTEKQKEIQRIKAEYEKKYGRNGKREVDK